MLVALIAVIVVLGLHTASAARLDLRSPGHLLSSAAPCTTSTLSATAGTATTVVLTGMPAACAGASLALRLYGTDGTPTTTADTTGTANAGTVTLPVPGDATAQVAGVALVLNGWAVPVSWIAPATAPTGPVTPGPGTTFTGLTWSQISSSGTQACFTVQVSGAVGTTWRVDLHLDQRPFNGVTNADGFQVHSPWYGQVLGAPSGGVLSIGGRPGFTTLSAGQSITVTVCHYGLPAPQYDAALTYSQSTGPVSGAVTYACMSTTVRVSGTPQFYAGWRADIDLRPLLDYLTARGVSTTNARFSAPGNYTLAQRSGTVYRVTPTAWDTWGIRDDAPRSVQVCVQP
ncbi:hypothetical protein [Cellulomonas sp. NPDC089187]|uniref:hypothetical protein n=1 Tax=Cellulomonas sp. NPDC089187 TaxID=3154970 RepID=UPI00343BEA2B